MQEAYSRFNMVYQLLHETLPKFLTQFEHLLRQILFQLQEVDLKAISKSPISKPLHTHIGLMNFAIT